MSSRISAFVGGAVFVVSLVSVTFFGYSPQAKAEGGDLKVAVRPIPKDADEASLSKGRPDSDNPHRAFEWRRQRMADEFGQIPAGSLQKAIEQRQSLVRASTRVAGDNWIEAGPTNIMGRALSILCSPTNHNVVIVGTAGGGVWKSSDAGASWARLGDSFGSMAVGSLAYDPTTEQTIYAGTGEGYFNGDAIQGVGIYKTTNGGATWSVLPGTSSFLGVNRIAVDPTNNKHLLISALYGGIYQSTDGGLSWTNTHFAQAGRTLLFSPTDSKKVLATVLDYNFTTNAWFNQVLTSSDGGTTWTNGGLSITDFNARIEGRYVPGSSSQIYLSVATSGGVIYKSTDGGATFTQVTTSGTTGASWYNNDLWVDPKNPNRLAITGTYTYGSTDGGVSVQQISQGYILTTDPHPDNHAFAAPFDYDGVTHKTLYVLTDGGVFKTNDITTAATGSGWITCYNGANTTQFYSIAGDGPGKVVFGGTQDNGTLVVNTSNTKSASYMFGGDGGFVAMDPTNTNYAFGEYIDLNIFRSTTGAFNSNANYITSGLNDAGSNADFIAPFVIDPNSPTTLIAGGASVWRCTNADDATPTWNAIRSPGTAHISAIAIAKGNSNIIYVGQDDGAVAMTTNGTSGSPTWSTVGSGTLPGRTCTRLLIDPSNASVVYAAFGGFSSDNLYKSADGGSTWSAITGSGTGTLPSVPIYAIARNPNAPQTLYVGTEVGIFSTSNGGTSWSTTNDGPNAAEVDDLQYLNNSTQLAAGTHGRGIWLLDTGGSQLQSFNLSSSTVVGGSSVTGTVTLKSAAPSSGTIIGIYSSGAQDISMPDTVTVPSGATSATFTINSNAVTATEIGSITVQLGQSSMSQNLSVVQTAGNDAVSNLQLASASVIGGLSDTATVSLAGPAPMGGQLVRLSSSNQNYVGVPSTVTVAAGSTSATFTVTTKTYNSTYQASITASDPSGTKATKITVVNDTVSALSFSPSTVAGGTGSTGTVTLTSAAPTQGWTVNLSCSNQTYVTVPTTVTVPSGATTATFSVATKRYTSTYQVSVTASCPYSAKASILTILYEAVSNFSVTPSSIVGGSNGTGQVTLVAAAPAGGFPISVASSNQAYVGVPTNVTVLAGATSVTFPVTTKAYGSTYQAGITASCPGSAKAFKINVLGDSVSSVALQPASVVGGSPSTGTVTIASPAPAGGWVVNLTSSNKAIATVPVSVTIAAGATSATFTIATSTVTSKSSVTITGTDLTSHRAATLTVNP